MNGIGSLPDTLEMQNSAYFVSAKSKLATRCMKDAQGLVLFWRMKAGRTRQKNRSEARSSLTPLQMGKSSVRAPPICCVGTRPNNHETNSKKG